jgi:hypothetical protein
VGVLEGPVCENGRVTPWVGLPLAHFQNSRKFGVFTIFRGFGAHAGRDPAVVVAGEARRWVGVMEGPTGAPLGVALQAFLGLKNRNFRPFGSRNASETAEIRLEKRPSFGQGRGQRSS